MSVECPTCGSKYKNIACHWTKSCEPPELSNRQIDIIRGLLLGDASFHGSGRYISIEMVSKEFLEWIKGKLDILATKVRLHRTAEENATTTKEYGGSGDSRKYSDTYVLQTRSLDWIESEKQRWYKNGNKHIPENIDMGPVMAKMWYVSDGTIDKSSGKPKVKIRASFERNSENKIQKVFSDSGFDVNTSSNTIYFNVNEGPRFLNWIGEAPPGFEYKWPW